MRMAILSPPMSLSNLTIPPFPPPLSSSPSIPLPRCVVRVPVYPAFSFSSPIFFFSSRLFLGGLPTKYSVALEVLSEAVHLAQPNDGLVEMAVSCQISTSSVPPSPLLAVHSLPPISLLSHFHLLIPFLLSFYLAS